MHENTTLELLAECAGDNCSTKSKEGRHAACRATDVGTITIGVEYASFDGSEIILVSVADIPFDLAKQICTLFRDWDKSRSVLRREAAQRDEPLPTFEKRNLDIEDNLDDTNDPRR